MAAVALHGRRRVNVLLEIPAGPVFLAASRGPRYSDPD